MASKASCIESKPREGVSKSCPSTAIFAKAGGGDGKEGSAAELEAAETERFPALVRHDVCIYGYLRTGLPKELHGDTQFINGALARQRVISG